MLVLSRKSNEALVIGEDIQVKVLSINGNRVKLGIEAPHHCRIIRAELAEEPANTAGGPAVFDSADSWSGDSCSGELALMAS